MESKPVRDWRRLESERDPKRVWVSSTLLSAMADHRRIPNTKCSVCATPVYRRPITINAKADNIFCSSKCFGSRRAAFRTLKTCLCGVVFEIPTYIEYRRKYCSRSCANSARRGLRYTGNKFVNHRTALLVELQRVSGIKHCMVIGCGYYRTLDMHRVIQGKNGGEYNTANAFAICPNHHAEVHRGVITLVVAGPFQLHAIETGNSTQLDKYMKNGELKPSKTMNIGR